MATMNKKDLYMGVAHWPGKSMAHVDALSHYPRCMLIDTSVVDLLTRIEKALQNDVKRISDFAEAQKIDGYVMRGGIFFKEVDNDLRVVVPASLRFQVIRYST